MHAVGHGHEHAGLGAYVPNQRAPDLVPREHYAPPARTRSDGCLSKTKSAKLEFAGACCTRVLSLPKLDNYSRTDHTVGHYKAFILPERPELSVPSGLKKATQARRPAGFYLQTASTVKRGHFDETRRRANCPPANLRFRALPPWLRALKRSEMRNLHRREA